LVIMVISDLHYEHRVFRGVDESRAWSWLLEIVDLHRPSLLISLGDWGTAVSEDEFSELLHRVRVWSIYGNHENLELLKRLRNLCGEPVLMSDAEVRVFEGIRFGAINGIVALRRRERGGVPRKLPEEFVELGRRLRGRVDVLLLHDSPYIPSPEYSAITRDERVEAVESAIREASPKLALCGHMHVSPYTVHRFPWGTTCVRIDSSQQHRAYALLRLDGVVELWIDRYRCCEVRWVQR